MIRKPKVILPNESSYSLLSGMRELKLSSKETASDVYLVE